MLLPLRLRVRIEWSSDGSKGREVTLHEAFAGRDELRYGGLTPNEPLTCH